MKEMVKAILDRFLLIESIVFAVYTGLMIISVTFGDIDLETSFILVILFVIGYHVVTGYFDYTEVKQRQKDIANTTE